GATRPRADDCACRPRRLGHERAASDEEAIRGHTDGHHAAARDCGWPPVAPAADVGAGCGDPPHYPGGPSGTALWVVRVGRADCWASLSPSVPRMAYSPLAYRPGEQPAWKGMRMPVEMNGWIAPRVASEIMPPSGPPFNTEVIAETARLHEQAGFDRVLIGYFSHAPDGFLIGAHAAAVTTQ